MLFPPVQKVGRCVLAPMHKRCAIHASVIAVSARNLLVRDEPEIPELDEVQDQVRD